MPLFRCLNEACSDAGPGELPVLDFEAPTAVCPKCSTAMKDNPRQVVPRETIHYLVNDKAGLIRTPNGRRAVACDPARAKLPKFATATPTAVSCPACKASPAYLADVAGNLDQGAVVVTKDVPPALHGGAVNPDAATE
ncbi:MAG: hypothetical protein U0804_28730 [Gemmataceae bacterium]